MSPRSKRPRKPMNPVPVEERGRKQPVTIDSPAAAATKGSRKRVLIPIAVGAGAAAGTGYLIHRSRQKKETTMSKNLINPFEEVVVFGKAYPVALPVPGAKVIRALVPTGNHVGHGQKLTHVRNGKGGGGRATKLERYTGGHAKQASGPFGKALAYAQAPTAARVAASGAGRPSTARGLAMAAGGAKPKSVPSNGGTAARAKEAWASPEFRRQRLSRTIGTQKARGAVSRNNRQPTSGSTEFLSGARRGRSL